jgi:hypothetical protein
VREKERNKEKKREKERERASNALVKAVNRFTYRKIIANF